MHERQVQAVLRPVLQLGERVGTLGPAFLPCFRAGTDVLGELGEVVDGECRSGREVFGVFGTLAREEGLDAVGKVGKGEELAAGESVEEGGLVDAVERAGRDFANTVLSVRVHTLSLKPLHVGHANLACGK